MSEYNMFDRPTPAVPDPTTHFDYSNARPDPTNFDYRNTQKKPAPDPLSKPSKPVKPKRQWAARRDVPGIIAFLVIVFVAVMVVIGMHTTPKVSSAELRYDAFNACEQFVRPHLKAPGTATFRDPTANNGDTTISGAGDEWVVASSVDSENGFGAKLRSTFVCAVHHVGGAKWTLTRVDVVDGGAVG